jgi:hypothetical protein
VYWINPIRYTLQGLVVKELRDGKEYLNEATGGLVSGDDLLDFLGGLVIFPTVVVFFWVRLTSHQLDETLRKLTTFSL